MATAAEDDRRDDETSDDEQEEAEPTGSESSSAEGEPYRAAAEQSEPTPARRKKKRAKRGTSETKRARPAAGRPAKRQGAMAKSMVLFLIIGGLLFAGLFFLTRGEEGGAGQANQPKWTKGQKADVEITLVYTDQQDLACASTDELAGKHCAFEAKGKPWSKGESKDDKTTFRPYTTTDRIQFLAAGLWTDAGMTKAPLPRTRFTVKCKLNVEGSIRKPGVRWAADGPWYDQGGDWYAGSVSDCNITP